MNTSKKQITFVSKLLLLIIAVALVMLISTGDNHQLQLQEGSQTGVEQPSGAGGSTPDVEPKDGSVDSDPLNTGAEIRTDDLRNHNELLAHLGELLPGLAGVYADPANNNRIHVRVKRDDGEVELEKAFSSSSSWFEPVRVYELDNLPVIQASPETEERVEGVLEQYFNVIEGDKTIIFETADYTLVELKKWHDELLAALLDSSLLGMPEFLPPSPFSGPLGIELRIEQDPTGFWTCNYSRFFERDPSLNPDTVNVKAGRIHSIDLNEQRSIIVLGSYCPYLILEMVESLTHRLDIPNRAVSIEHRKVSIPHHKPTGSGDAKGTGYGDGSHCHIEASAANDRCTIRDLTYPTVGGTQLVIGTGRFAGRGSVKSIIISASDEEVYGLCTLGVNVTATNFEGMLTAAHCLGVNSNISLVDAGTGRNDLEYSIYQGSRNGIRDVTVFRSDLRTTVINTLLARDATLDLGDEVIAPPQVSKTDKEQHKDYRDGGYASTCRKASRLDFNKIYITTVSISNIIGDNCYELDVSFVEYKNRVEPGVGLIARPAMLNQNIINELDSNNTMHDNLLAIDHLNPYFVIGESTVFYNSAGRARYKSSLMSTGVHKVGRSTGWTAGTITETCVFIVTGVMVHTTTTNDVVTNARFCEHGANYIGVTGDSGSPVFTGLNINTSNGNVECTSSVHHKGYWLCEVQLVGIHNSGTVSIANTSPRRVGFSPIEDVHDLFATSEDFNGELDYDANLVINRLREYKTRSKIADSWVDVGGVYGRSLRNSPYKIRATCYDKHDKELDSQTVSLNSDDSFKMRLEDCDDTKWDWVKWVPLVGPLIDLLAKPADREYVRLEVLFPAQNNLVIKEIYLDVRSTFELTEIANASSQNQVSRLISNNQIYDYDCTTNTSSNLHRFKIASFVSSVETVCATANNESRPGAIAPPEE